MIVTDQFVFLHLHKSGGSFVNEFLMRFLPTARQIGYHLPWKAVPQEFADFPALGLVRNPWSYYVSWYSFQKQRPRQNLLFNVLSDSGALGFEPTLRNMLSLCEGGPRLDALVAGLPSSYTNRGLNLPGRELAAIAGSGHGFYTFLFNHIYGGATQARIGRMERLHDELPNHLVAFGQSVTTGMREWIANTAATNTSVHAPYASYFSAELRDLVALRDRSMIESHGYAFGDAK